jgi:hypothetical protein
LKDVKPDEPKKGTSSTSIRVESFFSLVTNDFIEPSTFKEKLKHEEWKKTMIYEYKSMIQMVLGKLLTVLKMSKPLDANGFTESSTNQMA